jgi:hypothetical protein
MRIDLPPDVAQRVKIRAAIDKLESEVEVIRKALDSLDWQDQERNAIQQGIDAWQAGDTKEFHQFDAEFRAQNGIPEHTPRSKTFATCQSNGRWRRRLISSCKGFANTCLDWAVGLPIELSLQLSVIPS